MSRADHVCGVKTTRTVVAGVPQGSDKGDAAADGRGDGRLGGDAKG